MLGLALVWATAWTIAGVAVYMSGSDELALAEHVRPPATGLERGADVRVEEQLADGAATRHMMAWIFGALGPPPILIVALVWWRRSRRREVPSPA